MPVCNRRAPLMAIAPKLALFLCCLIGISKQGPVLLSPNPSIRGRHMNKESADRAFYKGLQCPEQTMLQSSHLWGAVRWGWCSLTDTHWWEDKNNVSKNTGSLELRRQHRLLSAHLTEEETGIQRSQTWLFYSNKITGMFLQPYGSIPYIHRQAQSHVCYHPLSKCLLCSTHFMRWFIWPS